MAVTLTGYSQVPLSLSTRAQTLVTGGWTNSSFAEGITIVADRSETNESRAVAIEFLHANRRKLTAAEMKRFLDEVTTIGKDNAVDETLAALGIRTMGNLALTMEELGQISPAEARKEARFLMDAATNVEGSVDFRVSAINTLGILKITEASSLLQDILGDDASVNAPEISRPVCLSLMRIDGELAVATLAGVLRKTTDSRVFGTAAFAIGQIKNPESMVALVQNIERFPGSSSCDAALVDMEEVISSILKIPDDPNLLYAIRATRDLWREGQTEHYVPLLRHLITTAPKEARRASLDRLLEAASTMDFKREKEQLAEILEAIGDQSELVEYQERVRQRLSANLLIPSAGHGAEAPTHAKRHELLLAQDRGNISAQEYGDAVYRELDGLAGFLDYNYNHTAIFAGLDSNDFGRVRQGLGSGSTTQETYFDSAFIYNYSIGQPYNYYGAYTLDNRTMSFTDRKNVVTTATNLVNEAIPYPPFTLGVLAPKCLLWNGTSFDGSVADISNIRCDGFVEYAYEKNGFRVWRNQSYADDTWSIVSYPDYHNDRPDSTRNPEREASPWAQRGAPCATGPIPGNGCSYSAPDTKMTSAAIINFPTYQVTGSAGNGYVDVTVTATDESGIHYIAYKRPGDSDWLYSPTRPQDPTSSSYSYLVRVTSSGFFYTFAMDNGGNYPDNAPGYLINVTSTATLTSLSISGPSSVNENSTAQYVATATFSDGTSQTVTPTWSENSTATTISASGALSAGSVTANTAATVSASYTVGGITKTASKTVTVLNLTSALTSLSIAGPGSVPENGTGQFTATAFFSDGSSQVVTPIWSENSSATTISASGLLSAGSVGSDTLVTVSASYTAGSITKTANANVTIVNSGSGGTQTQELINNGGFESGTTGWSMFGPVVPSTGLYPHTGTKYAVLGETNFATDVMYQTFTIPANATNVTLTYWYNIVSAEAPTAEFDILNVSIRDTNLALIAAVDHKSNLNKDPGPGNPYYHQKTFDLTPYRGQTVRIHFLGQTDGATLTSFKIDDVSAIATIPQPVTLSSLAISGPSSLSEGTTAQYSATAVFSDGTTQTVTPTWSENSSVTSISGNGVLSAGQVNADTIVTVSASYTQSGVTRSATKDVTVVNIAPVFNFLSISGPSSISENSTGQFSAIAFFSDGTSQTVSPIWTENSAATSISSSGMLSAGEVDADTVVTVSASHTIAGVTQSDNQSVVIVNVPVSTPTPPPTPTPTPRPSAPTATADTNRTSNSFTANWNSVSGANGYRLDVGTNSSFGAFVSGYQNLDVGNVLSKNVTGLNANTTYYYRVRAYNSGGTSSNSNVINVTTTAVPTPTPTPTATPISSPVATLLSPSSGAALDFPHTFSWSLSDNSSVKLYLTATPNAQPGIDLIVVSSEVFSGDGSLNLSAARWANVIAILGPAETYYWTVGDANLEDGIFAGWQPFTLAPTVLGNIATRLSVGTGDNVLIGGFIITGSQPKKVIIRAIGPSLSAFGISDVLADPILELHDSTGALTASNNNWKESQQGEIQGTGLAPSNDLESAIVRTLDPGAYTAILRGASNTTGVALVESYDLDRGSDSKLANISTRGLVQTGDNVMIGGLIVQGADPTRFIVRAIGPSLSQFGITNSLQDPTLELHDGNGALLTFDDNWRDNQQSEIQATGLAPSNNAESAIVATLSPGLYTAIVRGKNDTSGVALVEAYQLDN